MSPNGEILIAGDGAVAAAHDADTLDVVHPFDASPYRVTYRPDGEQVAVSTQTYTTHTTNVNRDVVFDTIPVRLLNGATLEPEPVQLGGWPAGAVEAWDLDYSADGRRLAADLCVMHDWEHLGLHMHVRPCGTWPRPTTRCRASRPDACGGLP